MTSNNNSNIRHRTSSAKHGVSVGGTNSSPKVILGGSNSNNNVRSKHNTNNNSTYSIHIGVWSRIVLIVGSFTILTIMVKEVQRKRVQQQKQPHDAVPILKLPPISTTTEEETTTEIRNKCTFRSYPSNRLYGLFSKSPPNFLSDAAYIRGQWPIIINPNYQDNIQQQQSQIISPPTKVCLDTTSWENLIDENGKERLPFTDGHNPSVVSLSPNPYLSPSSSNNAHDSYSNSNNNNNNSQQHVRLDPKHLGPITSAFPTHPLNTLHLSVAIFGGGQCKFGFTPQQINQYNYSLHEEPPGGKRAVIAILDSSLQTIGQTTLLLEKDARYGTSKRRAIDIEKKKKKNENADSTGSTTEEYVRMHQEFDDPRLFFHLGRVWVLYRNGPLFGYTDQVHNPIHFEEVVGGEGVNDNEKFVAYVKASETIWIGGGRNIALISEEPTLKKKNVEEEQVDDWVPNPSLKALTWVDPITVRDDVDLRGVDAKLLLNDGSSQSRRRLLEEKLNTEPIPSSQQHHRRLGSKPNKSNIHGTNGYMVPLTSTGELMGIAHFHRPEHRKESEYALHGHHYTHAFFTIARQADSNHDTTDGTSQPFKLKRLSNEFVFRTNSIPIGETQPPRDGDIIQFASGLDVSGGDVDGKLIISYGINDCEGAVFTMSMAKVQEMLLEVRPGQEVVDLMETVNR